MSVVIGRILRWARPGTSGASSPPGGPSVTTAPVRIDPPGRVPAPDGARRWHAFEARLADGSIKEGVICLANGDRITIGPATPVLLGPGDAVLWRERHGWGWSMADPNDHDSSRGSVRR